VLFNSPVFLFAFLPLSIWLFWRATEVRRCSIPDDCIDKRRFPLFFARDVLQALVAELKAENAVAPE